MRATEDTLTKDAYNSLSLMKYHVPVSADVTAAADALRGSVIAVTMSAPTSPATTYKCIL